MKRSVWLVVAIGLVGIAGYAAVQSNRNAPAPVTGQADATPQTDSAGMCPWRSPKTDLPAFFPTATRYEQTLLILSDLRAEVSNRLGPKSNIDANGIYYYRVYRGNTRLGSVIAQRTPGEYGVVEYVEAFDNAGKIDGVKIQRLREPDATAKSITSKEWLGKFDGHDADSAFDLGSDIPNVGQSARLTANSLTNSIRRLTIEYDVALAHGR